MAFQKPLPEWKKQGIRPPESKITEGYNVMDKPPAAWMNWHMNTTYEALEELQNNAAEKTDVTSALSEAKSYADQKVADIDLSKITPEYIGAETPAGAQAKANQAEANAKNYVNTSFVKKAIYLPANTDMNNVRDEGEYYNPANAEVSTFANRPDDQSCYVKVSKHAGVNQTWYVFNPSDNRVFTRNFYNNSWGPWKKVLNIDDYNELKHSGVEAKNKIAGAINAKGVPASANDTFDQLAGKIGQISTGGRIDVSNSAYGETGQGTQTVMFFTLPASAKNAYFADAGNRNSSIYASDSAHAALVAFDDTGIRLPLMTGNPDAGSQSIVSVELVSQSRQFIVKYASYGSTSSPASRNIPIPDGFNINGEIRIAGEAYAYRANDVASITLSGSTFLY
ncbi:pyocin knob domain-containing protein [Paenibacillus apiarius]|uniref:pyocin knob domain-containing protein n=1 Tax=Paenibacillus apiarius TaxID=46240 RepID=UPI0019813BFF|nr:pyocin knob domain-containing protein [Paenibacillus apiarius]MBN3523478.1 hypothetical protein [Paenibacillus apiarius]